MTRTIPATSVAVWLLVGVAGGSPLGCDTPVPGRARVPAPPPAPAEAREEADDDGDGPSLERAFVARLTVWLKASGERTFVSHCRHVRGGCRERLASFAHMMETEAQKHGLDPFLLGAVAMRESALNPAVVGPAGSYGIVQLHPRGTGAGTRLARHDAYRKRCITKVDACQQVVVERGAKHLAEWIEHCDGLESALGGYNSGRCEPTGYARRVLEEKERLLRLARTDAAGS